MEIDNGASLSVISEATYAVSYSEGKVPPLWNTDVILREAKRVPRGNSILRWEIIQVTFTRCGREGSSSPGEKLAGENTLELAYD
jgi:hypothetical protein